MSNFVQIDDFFKIQIRCGRIISAGPFPEARQPAFKLQIDFGKEIGIKLSSAKITELYTPNDLVGRLVLAITNLSPKRIAGFKSEVLVLGLKSPEGVVLIQPDRDVPLGEILH